jgi:hypothetical protein
MVGMRLQTPAQDWAWMQQHATLTAVIALAALLALLALTHLARAAGRHLRHLTVATVVRAIATPTTLLWEAQGTYRLATTIHVPHDIALIGAGLTSSVLVALAASAHQHHQRHHTLGPCGRYTWYVAIPMGLVVSLSEPTVMGKAIRIILPLLAVLLWYSQYVPDEPAGASVRRGSWRWTPRRVGVVLGLLDPTDVDLVDVHTRLRVATLTRHGNGLHHGPAWLRAWHGARLRRAALGATDRQVAEAQRNVTRVHHIEASTAPAGADPEHLVLRSGWWLAPWSAARSTARSNEVLRSEQSAERQRAEHEVLRSAEVLRVERQRAEQEAEQTRSAHAAAVAAILAEHAAAIEDLRREHAAERSGAVRPERSTPYRSAAPRIGAPRTGAVQGSGAPELTDVGAVGVMLRAHPAADYDWGSREVRRLTGAGFGRIPKLIAMVAEHHERTARPDAGDGDEEREPAAYAI